MVPDPCVAPSLLLRRFPPLTIIKTKTVGRRLSALLRLLLSSIQCLRVLPFIHLIVVHRVRAYFPYPLQQIVERTMQIEVLMMKAWYRECRLRMKDVEEVRSGCCEMVKRWEKRKVGYSLGNRKFSFGMKHGPRLGHNQVGMGQSWKIVA
ncbi:unnamed protein product [Vicia faba]|uniref:Uncharacterized protein n=1 Tax=Vicia faba TaxID=3906 RepID=A0AAV0ZBJ4_VICFA|nr:unnamed protein product [Vicia faba]